MESFVLMRAQETLSNVFIAFFTFILKFCIILLYFGLEFFFFSLGLSLTLWVVVEITGSCLHLHHKGMSPNSEYSLLIFIFKA